MVQDGKPADTDHCTEKSVHWLVSVFCLQRDYMKQEEKARYESEEQSERLPAADNCPKDQTRQDGAFKRE
ncbi:hypothetical protein AW02_021550 [Bacillus velezensis NJN-6]|nr:hypothetical protein AW02_021550 [Bacillus velezensis NJN-6]MBG9464073.1 hypothetical protein [Bacillus amyloliquefaciens]OQV37798.1 hypothetical protein B5M57_18330 [Bacillus velezensis]